MVDEFPVLSVRFRISEPTYHINGSLIDPVSAKALERGLGILVKRLPTARDHRHFILRYDKDYANLISFNFNRQVNINTHKPLLLKSGIAYAVES